MREELAASAQEELAAFRNLLSNQDDDLDDEGEFDRDEDGEGPIESLLRHAPEIEAGLWPGWKLDRSQPGTLVWTTPSGRQYKSTLDGSSYAPYPASTYARAGMPGRVDPY
jgi:hypothetical protein